MNNVIYQKYIVFIFIYFLTFSLEAFPGDHEGYTCGGFRSTNCTYDSSTGLTTSPMSGNPPGINQTCGSKIHDPYHFTMFGDSLTDFVDYYGLSQGLLNTLEAK